MSRFPITFAILLLAGGLCRAEPEGNPTHVGQLPGEKTAEILSPKERNPFTRRDEKPTQVVADRESEETQLRAILQAMPVTGHVRGGGNDKVLLGSLILEVGEPLPPLLDKQVEKLAVAAITDKRVEIQFLEVEPTTEPRRIFIPIDLHPRVTAHLPKLPKVTDSPKESDIRVPE